MTEATTSVLQLEGTIRGGPTDNLEGQQCDENSPDSMDMMMSFGSDSLSEMMPNMESILTMPKSTPPPTISELFCRGNNSSPDDDFDQLAGQAWYSGGSMASRYLDGDGNIDEFEPAAKRSASGTPIGAQFQKPKVCLEQVRRDAPMDTENSRGSRPLAQDGPDRGLAAGEDVYDQRHKRKLADRSDPRATGLHLHNKNGAFFKNSRSGEDSEEIMNGDPMRVYRKTIMALGRENFFLKQQFGNANNQVVHLSRQLAIATEENQKLRSIVGKLGLGRSFGEGLARFRGMDDSYIGSRMDDERTLPRPPQRPDQPPAAHQPPLPRGFDAPSHPQPPASVNLSAAVAAADAQRRAKGPEEAMRQRPRPLQATAWQQQQEEEEERWRWRAQLQQPPLPAKPAHVSAEDARQEALREAEAQRKESPAGGGGKPEGDGGGEKRQDSKGGTPRKGREVEVPTAGAVSATASPKAEGKERGGGKGKGGGGKDGPTQPRFWTKEEHGRFLEAVRMYGYGNAREIAAYVQTRSITQVRTHAQKYILKLSKMGSHPDKDKLDGASPSDPPSVGPDATGRAEDDDQSLAFLGEKDDPTFQFPTSTGPGPLPSTVQIPRMQLEYGFHRPGEPGRASAFHAMGGPRAPGGEDDPSAAAAWIENMELSNTFLDRGPSR